MQPESIKSKIKAFLFGSMAIVIVIILIRILLKISGANPNSEFVSFWYEFSGIFVSPFDPIFPSSVFNNGKNVLETFSFIAIITYLVLTSLVYKLATIMFEHESVDILRNIVDSIFKVIEFLLIARFVLRLGGASVLSNFVDLIYTLSGPVFEPFADILPIFSFNHGENILETSTLVAIVIIIIFDVVSDVFMKSLAKSLRPSDPNTAQVNVNIQTTPSVAQPIPVQQIPVQVQQPLSTQRPTNAQAQPSAYPNTKSFDNYGKKKI